MANLKKIILISISYFITQPLFASIVFADNVSDKIFIAKAGINYPLIIVLIAIAVYFWLWTLKKQVARKTKALIQSEAHYQALFESASDSIFIIKDGLFAECNPKTLKMFDCSKNEIIGKSPFDLSPENQPDGTVSQEKALEKITKALCGEVQLFEWQHKRLDNTVFDVEVRLDKLKQTRGDYILAVVRDLTERREFESQLELARNVFDNAVEGVVVTNTDGIIEFVNKGFENITGFKTEEAIGQNPNILKSNYHQPDFYENMWATLNDQGFWRGEIWNRRKNGETYPEWLTISAIKNSHGKTIRYMSIFHDLTETKKREEQLHYQANHDALTGLPNRVLFQDRLNEAILQANRNNWGISLFFLDLDKFKNINDTIGHAKGDILIKMVSERLKECIRKEDTIARLGGDEFVYLMQRNTNPKNIINAIDRIKSSMIEPFKVSGYEFHVTVGIGITTYPNDGEKTETLLSNADIALYQAKKRGRNQYQFYTHSMNVEMQRLVELENHLQKAVARNEIVVHYQPKLDLKSGLMAGMEALVRWHRQDEGIISPVEFLPLAEDSGLIVSIGEQVLKESCRKTMELRTKGFSNLKVAVNLSARQFQEPDLVDMISNALTESGLPGSALELEVTENALIHEADMVKGVLLRLREMGIKIALDDFGTGYSSLSYLRTFPIDVLKIDKSFVDDIPTDSEANMLVTSILNMAKGLGIEVIAEGVESKNQLDFLAEYDCRFVQGYFFSRPLSNESIEEFINKVGHI